MRREQKKTLNHSFPRPFAQTRDRHMTRNTNYRRTRQHSFLFRDGPLCASSSLFLRRHPRDRESVFVVTSGPSISSGVGVIVTGLGLSLGLGSRVFQVVDATHWYWLGRAKPSALQPSLRQSSFGMSVYSKTPVSGPPILTRARLDRTPALIASEESN